MLKRMGARVIENRVMTVVQCWDDGVSTDARLVEILRRHGSKATFNLNANSHGPQRKSGWSYKGAAVYTLAWGEMRELFEGFPIANHSLTHPHLDRIPIEAARQDIVEGRDRLQQFFGQPVAGFAYPFGTYNPAVMDAVREAGHVYARTTEIAERPFPPADAMAFHPCGHFLAPDFWERYEKARPGGVFYFWGHSFEMIDDAMWDAFDAMIARISADPLAQWGDVVDLFVPTSP